MSTQDNANNNEQLLLPGRLGDPQRDWRSDPRVDPFMIAAIVQRDLDDAAADGSAVGRGFASEGKTRLYRKNRA